MLTENQLIQLQPLTEHPKYGKILQDAIPVWQNVIPILGSFGISGFPIFESQIGCCLLGAAMVGKENFSEKWSEITNKYFNLTKEEHHSIQYGFDGLDKSIATNKDAYFFGKEVSNIVRPISAASLC